MTLRFATSSALPRYVESPFTAGRHVKATVILTSGDFEITANDDAAYPLQLWRGSRMLARHTDIKGIKKTALAAGAEAPWLSVSGAAS